MRSSELAPAERDLVLKACLHFDAQRMLVHNVVVMPDHVHLLITPVEKTRGTWWSLSELLHSIKSVSANEISALRRQNDPAWSGSVWQDESFDRIIRSESDFEEKRNYILANPAKRGLPEDYRWLWDEGGAGILPALKGQAPDAEPRAQEAAPGRQDACPTRTSLLVWTTTPWTLLSNHFAAVHPELEYALVHDPVENEHLYVAAALVDALAKKLKRELSIVSTCTGAELLGLRYVPPFTDLYYARLGDTRAALRGGGAAPVGWRVVAADFVTIESGTGLVHEAPAFGEVDFNLLLEERKRFEDPDAVPLLNAVNPDGAFNDDAPPRYRGRWVKDCDKEIIRELRDERKTPWGTPLLYHQEVVRHEYPFCPRAEDDPLIQYARKSWFVRTSEFKDEFLRNNAAVNWLPEHIREGRFGDFLRNNVDWALSRERYWGTPLPIWVCEKCGRMEAVGSFAELRGKPGATDGGYWEAKVAEHRAEGVELPHHLQVHKPYIDEWTYACSACQGGAGFQPAQAHGPEEKQQHRNEGRQDACPTPYSTPSTTTPSTTLMRRVPEVIDCWWDAGSMPFAQWGYPHTTDSIRTFMERFPADFISEAIDQTRGWFYGLLAISTLLFGPRDCETADSAAQWLAGPDGATPQEAFPHPFRTCIVLGLILGEDGLKMSKRKKNYREPGYIFDQYGADAMRWYFFSGQPPWTSIRFQEAAIRDAQREFLVKLYNVLSFFSIYASIDGFEAIPDAAHGKRPTAERSELDRWIISELHRTIRFVRESMDRFENFPAAQRLSEFVEALSNWYVRRSRERFWRGIEGSRDQNAKEGYSANDQDKWDAYHTLYGCLYTLSLLIAPFTPFFAETMYQTLTRDGGGACSADQPARPGAPAHPVSVHLCDYPQADESLVDEALCAEMDIVREISSLGRAARAASSEPRLRKVRQPAALVEIILARPEHAAWLAGHAELIADELNVKRVEFAAEADQYVAYKVVPNFKAIGAKFRALVPKIKEALAALPDAAAARKQLADEGTLPLTIDGERIELSPDEIEIRLEAKTGWSAAQGRHGVVVLSSQITPELIEEGLIREFIHHVQALRKERELAYEARIRLHVDCADEFWAILGRRLALVRQECLCDDVVRRPVAPERGALSVEGHELRIDLA
ncbi:MAG: class I tRNA ligase family protein [Phycisphaerae bacterium]|nr:class I tRNA ligase family protein [Phycisphaerae bacterium]